MLEVQHPAKLCTKQALVQCCVWILFYTSDSLQEGGDCHVVNYSLDNSRAVTASANLLCNRKTGVQIGCCQSFLPTVLLHHTAVPPTYHGLATRRMPMELHDQCTITKMHCRFVGLPGW